MSELFALARPGSRSGVSIEFMPLLPLPEPPPGSLVFLLGILFFASLRILDILGNPNSSSSALSL